MLGSVSYCIRKHLSFKVLQKSSQIVYIAHNNIPKVSTAQFHTYPASSAKKDELVEIEKQVETKERVFKSTTEKNKKTFLQILDSYSSNVKGFRGHIEFIQAALRNIESYDAQFDLEVYKKLMDVFPKGKYMPVNMVQAEFWHFPRHQETGVDILDTMEWHGVVPDKEMKEIVLNVFGKRSVVYKKFGRMLYWMPKFKNLNPYETVDQMPSDIELLAELAMKKISVDPKTKITHFKTADLENVMDDTWIVSAQSPVQQELLKKQPMDQSIFVEGPYLIWLKRVSLSYFILRAEAPKRPVVEINQDDVSNLKLYMFGEPKPKHLTIAPETIHEQEDGIVFGACATGTSSKDSVLSWVRFLQQSNPILEDLPVLFKLKSITTAITTLNVGNQTRPPKEENFKNKSEQEINGDDEKNSENESVKQQQQS